MPISILCETCESEYTFRDELAGQEVECEACGEILLVPELDESAEDRPDRGYHSSFDRDVFLLNQKRISIDEKYYVYGKNDQPVLFIIRPARATRQIGALLGAIGAFFLVFIPCALACALFENEIRPFSAVIGIGGFVLGIIASVAVGVWISPRRHIYVYEDDSKTKLLLEILQMTKVNIIRATYSVRDPVDGDLGLMVKNYLYNFFRKKWVVKDPNGSTIVVAREDSLMLSLVRRYLPLLDFLPMILFTNFVFQRPDTQEVIGEFNRKMTFFDRYALDLTADHDHLLDRRLAVALGVLLDTGENR
jgi:hypothetical protein